jgi:hypothetical protein
MPHFRMFFSSDKWLTAADLYDEAKGRTLEVTLTIDKVVKGELIGQKGKKSNKPALYWKERAKDGSPIKPLGCCVANCSAVSQVAGSVDTDRWVGCKVTLYVEDIDIRGEGRRPALRIRPFTANQQRATRKSEPAPSGTPDDMEAKLIAEMEKQEADRG